MTSFPIWWPAAALVALVLLPALAGVALLLAGRRADRVAGGTALTVAAAGIGLAAVAAGTRPEASAPFLGIVEGGELRLAVDGLSAVLVVTVALVAALVVAFAVTDLPRGNARARFFGFLLLFVAAMLATVTAATFPALLLAWEVMGATSYALICHRWDLPGKVSAGTTAFLATRAGDLGLYVAAGAALAGSGSLVLDDLDGAGSGWGSVAAAGILLAALGKSAQLPFSAWLSAAMEGPSPVSALLHSATMVAAGGYLLLRVEPLLDAVGWAATAAAWAGALTALVLGAVACVQRDLKQLLAASTAAQIGFVVLAAGAGVTAGGTGQLVAHAAVKAALFVAAGAWLSALGTKQLAELRGAARRYPGMGAAATVAALALAGLPPLSLWATKDEVLAGVDGVALRAVALAAAALSAVYAGRVLLVVLSRPEGPGGRHVEELAARRVPALGTAAAGVLAAAAAGLGVLALPPVAESLKSVLGVDGEPSPGAAQLATSGALAVGVLVASVTALRARPHAEQVLERMSSSSWAGLRAVLSPRPVLATSRLLAAADERGLGRAAEAVALAARRMATGADRADSSVVDAAVRGVAQGASRVATGVAGADSGVVDAAVRGVADGVRRAGAAARRPQTGLVHQYYAQTAAALGVLLVLLLVVR